MKMEYRFCCLTWLLSHWVLQQTYRVIDFHVLFRKVDTDPFFQPSHTHIELDKTATTLRTTDNLKKKKLTTQKRTGLQPSIKEEEEEEEEEEK